MLYIFFLSLSATAAEPDPELGLTVDPIVAVDFDREDPCAGRLSLRSCTPCMMQRFAFANTFKRGRIAVYFGRGGLCPLSLLFSPGPFLLDEQLQTRRAR